jgi:hypothetical protein
MDYFFQDGGKTKNTGSKTKSKTGTKKTGSKKGGNFLGAVGELVAPTGWEGFATAAGLLAIDRADAALRRGKSEKSSTKKMSGGGRVTIKGPIYNSTPDKKGQVNPYKSLINEYTPNEQAAINKYFSNNRNIIEYYNKNDEEYTHIPKKTYDEIKQICIKKETARKNGNSNRPKYLNIRVAMQAGISNTLRKVYWDDTIFKLYHETVKKYGDFSLEKMASIPFFNEI